MARATISSKQGTRHMNVPRKEISMVTVKPTNEAGRASFKAKGIIVDGKITKLMPAGRRRRTRTEDPSVTILI
jgi:hypothetical protein